ncbi:type II toxin-antitoxin system HicB family antitoxin [Candidatus Methanoperedens nitratireducens]|nr:type II toxin-antitoxin system HicB family antitoxin [Candidatus Methanoperedens nitroreducens]
MMHKYAIEIFYSEEDEGYIAVVPELPGCSAFGETEEEALREIKVAIDLWLETAEKDGREIPKPAGKELLRTVVEGVVALGEVHSEGAGA